LTTIKGLAKMVLAVLSNMVMWLAQGFLSRAAIIIRNTYFRRKKIDSALAIQFGGHTHIRAKLTESAYNAIFN
jgi:hypothetical protein